MAISWCPNDGRIVNVPPKKLCPTCGTVTESLMLAHYLGSYRRQSFQRTVPGVSRLFDLQRVTKTGIVKLRPGKTRAGILEGMTLVTTGEEPIEGALKMLKGEGIKIGSTVTVTGTLATAGTRKLLFVESVAGSKELGGGRASLMRSRRTRFEKDW
jgi:hypothetical protein